MMWTLARAKRFATAAALSCCAAFFWGGWASAAGGSVSSTEDVQLPPWSGAETLIPNWARSVHILKGEQPLRREPRHDAKRRGSAAREANLPLFAARRGTGCHGPWLQVGSRSWVCEDDVDLSGAPPIRFDKPPIVPLADGMPFRYFFVSRDGSLAYSRVEEVDIGAPVMTLEPGFAVAVVEERKLGGQLYGRTNRGLWLPMRDLGAARSFAFRGEDIDLAPATKIVPFAWVVVDHASLYRRLAGGRSFVATGERRTRFQKVDFFEEQQGFGRSYTRIDEQRWIRSADIRHPTLAAAPNEAGISHGERWLDIELASQTLVAYEGHKPVFATLVSTGKSKRPGHPFETPKGLHRVWVKLVTSIMDNLENDAASRYWRIEDVPYVQYFAKAVGLHAAFWHRSFGHVRSHGCVNLAPLDAARLFSWTGPRVHAGWTAALPTTFDKGTLIRVR